MQANNFLDWYSAAYKSQINSRRYCTNIIFIHNPKKELTKYKMRWHASMVAPPSAWFLDGLK